MPTQQTVAAWALRPWAAVQCRVARRGLRPYDVGGSEDVLGTGQGLRAGHGACVRGVRAAWATRAVQGARCVW